MSERDKLAAHRAAEEFEALMLSNLTAALTPSDEGAEEVEEGLFSNSANGLYRQMFSEQLARTMAHHGGIGLADTILRQLGLEAARRTGLGAGKLAEIARQVREEGQAAFSEASPLRAEAAALRTEPTTSPTISDEETVELQMPLEGRISSRFGRRRDPIHGRRRSHSGVDIVAPRGTQITAAAAGTVVFAGRQGGYGKMVEIEHADGRRTRYAHAAQLLVSPGDAVEDGQPIATVGSTGRSTGPHLHFEVTENGVRVDPLQVLAKDSWLTRR
jgi:murein DD-endopeptidase MepM/ murein hydrolase activator NlpD